MNEMNPKENYDSVNASNDLARTQKSGESGYSQKYTDSQFSGRFISFIIRTPEWKTAGLFALIYFIIITPISLFRYTNYILLLATSLCTSSVFFIWVWGIFSLYKKKIRREYERMHHNN